MIIYCVLGSAPAAPDRKAAASQTTEFLVSFFDYPRAFDCLQ